MSHSPRPADLFTEEYADPFRKTAASRCAGVLKRWWVVLGVTALLGGGGAWGVFQIKPAYWASARILVEPPQAAIQGATEDHAGNNAALFANFLNTRLQMITSRQIAERVMKALHLSEWSELNGVDDPVSQLQGWLKVKQVKNSNLVDIGLEGGDAALVAKIVNTTVEEFLRYEQESMQSVNSVARGRIETELRGLEAQLSKTRGAIDEFYRRNDGFLTSGESVEAGRLTVVTTARETADLRMQQAKRELERFQGLLAAGVPYLTPSSSQRLAQVREQIRTLDDRIEYERGIIRRELFDNDPSVRQMKSQREELAASVRNVGGEDAQFELERLRQEVKFAEEDQKGLEALVTRQREAVLAQQTDQNKVNALNTELDRLKALTGDIAKKRLELEIHQGLITPNIRPIDRADEPTLAYWPMIPVMVPLAVALGFLAGIGLALALDAADHTVRRPEEAVAVVGWPLLSVVPRLQSRELRRRGRPRPVTERPDLRDRRAWEVFRHLRSGLLGLESNLPDGGALRSIVVTSAAAGEGKSLVAVNLAATCARAGESVLLVDADLRTPTVARHFPKGDGRGLADVLQDDLPWPEAVVETDVPNLTLLSAGRLDGVTADILGTVEMHDLLVEWTDRFDRVIVDAPPLLGLADARVTGRFADGVLLVVRAGVHGPKPLVRMKEIVEGEGLRPVGLVFNGVRRGHADVTPRVAAPRPGRRENRRPAAAQAA